MYQLKIYQLKVYLLNLSTKGLPNENLPTKGLPNGNVSIESLPTVNLSIKGFSTIILSKATSLQKYPTICQIPPKYPNILFDDFIFLILIFDFLYKYNEYLFIYNLSVFFKYMHLIVFFRLVIFRFLNGIFEYRNKKTRSSRFYSILLNYKYVVLYKILSIEGSPFKGLLIEEDPISYRFN